MEDDNWGFMPTTGWRYLKYFGKSGPRNAMIRAVVSEVKHDTSLKEPNTVQITNDVLFSNKTIAVFEIESEVKRDSTIVTT